jgi:DNA-binding NarL/FixJ family response regulator
VFRPWLEVLSGRFRLIQYDPRGCGLSSRGLAPGLTLEMLQLDLEAVVDHLGLEHFIMYGIGYAGANVGVQYAAKHPQRMSALILANALISKESIRAPGLFEIVSGQDWDTFLYSTVPRDTEPAQAIQHVELLKQAFDQNDFQVIMKAFAESDLANSLRRLTVPTLVLHPRQFAIQSVEEAAKVAQLARAHMVLIDGSYSVGDADSGMQAIDSFLADVPGASPDAGYPNGLSSREVEVLRLIAKGRTNPQIAADLVISVNTVQHHVTNILSKADLANRAEAAAYAQRNGLI